VLQFIPNIGKIKMKKPEALAFSLPSYTKGKSDINQLFQCVNCLKIKTMNADLWDQQERTGRSWRTRRKQQGKSDGKEMAYAGNIRSNYGWSINALWGLRASSEGQTWSNSFFFCTP
jgi:hypothetical protein